MLHRLFTKFALSIYLWLNCQSVVLTLLFRVRKVRICVQVEHECSNIPCCSKDIYQFIGNVTFAFQRSSSSMYIYVNIYCSTCKYVISWESDRMNGQMTSTPRLSYYLVSLCGKLTTHDPDTYIVLCLYCLHYFRSLTDLHRYRLLNHNILDTITPGENLPRISKDGSWLVAGGDIEPQSPAQPAPQSLTHGVPGLRNPSSGMPTPSPPPPPPLPPTIQVPQFRSLGPYHQIQNHQYHGFNATAAQSRTPSQSVHPPFPHMPFRPQNHYYHPQQMASNHGSPIPSPGPQSRTQHLQQHTTTFSPAAREFVPSGMTLKETIGKNTEGRNPPSPSHLQAGYSLQERNEQ